MKLTGIKYKNLSEEAINDELNTMINSYIQTEKTHLNKILENLITNFKENYLLSLNPLNIITKIKDYLLTLIHKAKPNKKNVPLL